MSSTAKSINAESILKELGRVWAELAQSADPNKAATLRACAMTLIVATTENEDQSLIGETIAKLMHEHPSRAIVIRLRNDDSEEVSARAVAQCWMPFGTRQQICSEQIEISTSRKGLDEVYVTLLGLMVSDLPVVLWCWGSEDFLHMPEFQPLLTLPDKVIVDSDLGYGKSRDALAALRKEIAAQRNISDLEWARITRWREEVARAFDTPHDRQWLKQAKRLDIIYGTQRTSVGPRYLASWFRTLLGPSLEVKLTRIEEPCEIRKVTLGDDQRTIEWDLHGILRRVADGHQTCISFPTLTEYDLLREELRVLGRDPVFERALSETAALAA